jgi:hypothetical protein
MLVISRTIIVLIHLESAHICIMSDKERKEFSAAIRKYTEKVSKNKKESKEFLVRTVLSLRKVIFVNLTSIYVFNKARINSWFPWL